MKNRREFVQALCASAGALPLLGGYAMIPDMAAAATTGEAIPWWKTAIIYQIYPRSFQDSNGDGIGDFPGMTARLAHLSNIGVDAVFINACFDSPNIDNGYDVRDYRRIHPDFGTMADFQAFVAEARSRKIRIILDMVFNHSSDEHEWFKQSRSSRDNPYRDFYFWRDPVNGGPPTNWPCAYGGSSWTFDETTGQYYLHHYAIKQPDLNWENPRVREELFAILNFWADHGADGFRFDCVGELSKPLPFRDMTPAELDDSVIDYRTSGARLYEYLKDMRAATHAHPNLYFLGEGWGMTRDRVEQAIDDRNAELDSAFRFDFMLSDIKDTWRRLPWSLDTLKAFNADNQFADNPHCWPIVFFEDHDFSRSINRFGSANPAFQVRTAKLLATMLLTLRGTPLIYQGEEIGMTNYPFTSVDQYDDIGVRNLWQDLVVTGKVPAAEYLANVGFVDRDNSRTPMQWDNAPQAGFTTSPKPWLPVNPNYPTVNVAAQIGNNQSTLGYYKTLIKLRRDCPELVFGTYRDVSEAGSRLYCYVRALAGHSMLIMLNFSDNPALYRVPADFAPARLIMTNLPDGAPTPGREIHLAPWQSAIFRVAGT
jgi:oligo-1,6-glucosidase